MMVQTDSSLVNFYNKIEFKGKPDLSTSQLSLADRATHIRTIFEAHKEAIEDIDYLDLRGLHDVPEEAKLLTGLKTIKAPNNLFSIVDKLFGDKDYTYTTTNSFNGSKYITAFVGEGG